MGARNNAIGSKVIANATIVTTAETVLVVSPPISLPFDSAQVVILCRATIITGTGASFINFLIRQGVTTAGVAITGNMTLLGFAAGQTPHFTCWGLDTPSNVAGQQYCFTATLPGTSGNSTVSDVSIYAFIL